MACVGWVLLRCAGGCPRQPPPARTTYTAPHCAPKTDPATHARLRNPPHRAAVECAAAWFYPAGRAAGDPRRRPLAPRRGGTLMANGWPGTPDGICGGCELALPANRALLPHGATAA
jgi:hypothetical protein